MINKTLFVYNSFNLFKILDEIKDNLYFDIKYINTKNHKKINFEQDENHLIISINFDEKIDNCIIIDNLPNSLSVYLKASVETLTARLKDSIEERPLISRLQDPLQLKEFITKHLFERSFYYEKSKFKVKTDDLDINTIVNFK